MLDFQKVRGRKICVDFEGGNMSSDGGLLLVSAIDKKLNFTETLGNSLQTFDQRCQTKVIHDYKQMLRQRIYGICAGHKDLNDHEDLVNDILFQTAIGKDEKLAIAATLSRFENKSSRQLCVEMNRHFVESFISSHQGRPKELILDFDATDSLLYGNQEGKFFHGYYNNYCYLPLYVFCGQQLLVAYLRPSDIDGALHTWPILAVLVKRFRQQWPGIRIIFRGDSGFCRHRMLNWCEKNKVDYIVGLACNKKLKRQSCRLLRKAQKQYNRLGKNSKLFCETWYQAGSWLTKRRVICKAEYNSIGPNQRYVVTNIKGNGRLLYQKLYCARGDMENRIKEQQLGLFANRTSCQAFWSNQFRMLLSSCAYILLERLRATALKGTSLAKAQMWTIREKIIKIAAIIRRNTRTVYIHLASCFPRKDLFNAVLTKIHAIN